VAFLSVLSKGGRDNEEERCAKSSVVNVQLEEGAQQEYHAKLQDIKQDVEG